MLVKVVCEASKHLAYCESHRTQWFETKKIKKLLLSITARTHVTFAPLVYDVPVFFPGMLEAFHWTPLATCAGKETAVVWLKPGESMCSVCECVCVCVCVCVLWQWHHTFHDVDVATVKRQRRGEGASLHTASLQLCSAFNWSSLSRRDLRGKISKRKKPWCSQYCLFISPMEYNSVSARSSDSLKWVTGFIFEFIFIFSGIMGCTNKLNAKSHISFCHRHIGLKMQYVR